MLHERLREHQYMSYRVYMIIITRATRIASGNTRNIDAPTTRRKQCEITRRYDLGVGFHEVYLQTCLA